MTDVELNLAAAQATGNESNTPRMMVIMATKRLRKAALRRARLDRLRLDGRLYDAVPSDLFPFGNCCRHCAFYDTPCHSRMVKDEFSCFFDARPDGMDVVFVLIPRPVFS